MYGSGTAQFAGQVQRIMWEQGNLVENDLPIVE